VGRKTGATLKPGKRDSYGLANVDDVWADSDSDASQPIQKEEIEPRGKTSKAKRANNFHQVGVVGRQLHLYPL
jgi:hypothetical protein